MQKEITRDSKHASIHDIVSENKRMLHKQQINQLFCPPDLSEMDLSEFHHHPYMINNDMFTFFVHELEKWNRKIRNKELKPFYHAELSRNMFLLSSLKIICLKKPNQIHKYLEELNLWYQKNSYNIPQPCVLMKKYNPNEEWEIRKTFKSNTTSEINHYRRRFLCSPDEKDSLFGENFLQLPKKKQNCFFQTKSHNRKPFSQSKTFEDDIQEDRRFAEPFRQIVKNKETKLTRLQHNEIRQKRQKQEIAQVQDSWKNSHSRFAEKTTKDFFKGKFSKSKQYSELTPRIEERKIQTAAFNNRRLEQMEVINSVKKGRIRTSLGIRKNFKHEQKEANLGDKSLELKTEVNEETRDESKLNWIDRFIIDEDKISIRNTFDRSGSGMLLISNPFDASKTKMKKKKR